jgi:hypothetical protein
MELGGGGKGKDNDRESPILKYFSFAQVGNIKICTESCQIMG